MRKRLRTVLPWGVASWMAVVPAAAGQAAATTTAPLPPRRPAVAAPPGLPSPLPLPEAIPLPPPRPDDPVPATKPVLGPPMPAPSAITAPAPTEAPVPVEDERVCVRLFGSGKVLARAIPPVGGTGGCGIAAPVELSAVIVAPGRRIAIEPAVTIDCALGEAVADWVRDDLVPAFATAGAPLARLVDTSGYACRGRNNVAGAKLSEHARGNAMDIGGFGTADGRVTGVRQAGAPVLATVKTTACARFATVLGPGSDGFHESHMHVDLEPRRHGATLCHWDQASTPAAGRLGPR